MAPYENLISLFVLTFFLIVFAYLGGGLGVAAYLTGNLLPKFTRVVVNGRRKKP